MEPSKCPFSAPLITRLFGCSKAQEVVRRGGAEIDCTDSSACARCQVLFAHLKKAALPAFGVEDDLLTMPHSVLLKIQYGGLLGLQREFTGGGATADKVENIDRLVSDLVARHGDAIPVDTVVADMTSFKLRTRRGR